MQKLVQWSLYFVGALTWSVLWPVFKALLLQNVERPANRLLALVISLAAGALAAAVVVGPAYLYRSWRRAVQLRREREAWEAERGLLEPHEAKSGLESEAVPRLGGLLGDLLAAARGRLAGVKPSWAPTVVLTVLALAVLVWLGGFFNGSRKVLSY